MAVADNSYIVTGADMVSLANKIREKAGVSDGLVWPDGFLEAIGSGGSIEFKTGTVTFTETQRSYVFVDDNPDLFILYVAPPFKNTDKNQNPDTLNPVVVAGLPYLWAITQYKKDWYYYTYKRNTVQRFIGYGTGSKKLYAAATSSAKNIGAFADGDFGSVLGAVTYRWFAFYGIGEFE